MIESYVLEMALDMLPVTENPVVGMAMQAAEAAQVNDKAYNEIIDLVGTKLPQLSSSEVKSLANKTMIKNIATLKAYYATSAKISVTYKRNSVNADKIVAMLKSRGYTYDNERKLGKITNIDKLSKKIGDSAVVVSITEFPKLDKVSVKIWPVHIS